MPGCNPIELPDGTVGIVCGGGKLSPEARKEIEEFATLLRERGAADRLGAGDFAEEVAALKKEYLQRKREEP